MQAITRELGLSETVFVIGGVERLRIFTPASEIPLAGHPVVGATLALSWIGRLPSRGRHVFRTGVGETPVELADGRATMTQAAFDPGHELDPADVAPLLALDFGEIVGIPRVCSTTGLRQAFARVRDRATLARLRPSLSAIEALTEIDGLVAWCEHDGELAQRFFAPAVGVDEDPATGSAAGALAALRVFEGASPGTVVVRQGDEIGRPSRIDVTVGGSPGAPEDVRVGGTAVPVLEGRLVVEL